MLYVTTRENKDPQTTPRALSADRGTDGGLFVPFQLVKLSGEERDALLDKSFSECIAEVLNLFFSCRMTCLDVDFAIGRNPLKLVPMNHRIVVAEVWHNLDNCYDRLECELAGKICAAQGTQTALTSWLRVGIRIAVLFGIFAQLHRLGMASNIDVAVPTGDFNACSAVWYGRAMGLPIGNIICSCNENSGVWELLHLGELHTDGEPTATTTPLADAVVPGELERLISGALGREEAKRFAEICNTGKVYRPYMEDFPKLREGMFSAVVSRSRLDALIPSVFRTNSYILGPYTALAYGGLMDYRAKTGETRPALMIAERSPICDSDVVCESMRFSVEELKAELDKM